MRILYVAHRYDYGDPTRGDSFEHFNFYESLVACGHEVTYFDFPTVAQEHGVSAMNRRLYELVTAQQPDVMFTVVWGDLLDRQTVRRISENSQTVTLNWYCDDHWRFDALSKPWTPCFNWVVTTAHSVLPRYEACGFENVIASQWACNPTIYRRLDLPFIYDVSFVGLPHGNRPQLIDRLRRAGVRVTTFGHGWPEGRLTQDEMIRVFNQSRINLNFAEASTTGYASAGRRWFHRRVLRPLHRVPSVWRLANAVRQWDAGKPKPVQIKARTFEVPGCGGFLLTGAAENLTDYYHPEREIATFSDARELVDQVRYFLNHEDERRQIADAGYQRTLREHTYAHRFSEVFQQIGLRQTDVVRRAA